MDCSFAGGLLVRETTIDELLEATDVALRGGSEATIIRGEAQD